MSNDAGQNKKKFDLKERTLKFARRVVLCAKDIPRNAVTTPLITQFVKAGTSIGANYCEADNAESRKDFIHKIGICNKESDETHYWAELLLVLFPENKELLFIFNESKEFNLIFVSIIKTTKNNDLLKEIEL